MVEYDEAGTCRLEAVEAAVAVEVEVGRIGFAVEGEGRAAR